MGVRLAAIIMTTALIGLAFSAVTNIGEPSSEWMALTSAVTWSALWGAWSVWRGDGGLKP